MEHYPSWRYHRTEPAQIVDTPEADEALGEGWADTPAAFLEDEKPKKNTGKKDK